MNKKKEIVGVVLALIVLLVVLKSAWLCDDAYITLRTVDNFTHGFGLRWNVAERVQSYTHPLWMLLLSLVTLFSREAYFTTLFLSLALAVLALLFLGNGFRWSCPRLWLGMLALAASKAFVDYSTSGLENPLTHLLLIAFVLIFLGRQESPRRLFWLSGVGSLLACCRLDAWLLVLPALVWAGLARGDEMARSRGQRLMVLLAGLAPLLVWEFFSLIYYGFPFPNTAYAKLPVNVSHLDLLRQGLHYFRNSLLWDPVTLPLILAGTLWPLFSRSASRARPLALGIGIYLLYILYIGGDFMSGRFFSAPLLAAILVLVASGPETRNKLAVGLGAVALLGLGCLAPYSTLRCRPDYHHLKGDGHGITDERGCYFQQTGLFRESNQSGFPETWLVERGKSLARQRAPLTVETTTGIVGYYAGPAVYIVDLLGLTDPLLARLPITSFPFRIGHFRRSLPPGYLESLASGVNRLQNPRLARYYDALRLVTRGPLFSPRRWLAIARLNLGRYDRFREKP